MGRPSRPLDVDALPDVRRVVEWLREARAASGLTLREIADRAGASPATLSRALSGAHLPSERTLHTLLAGLDVSPERRAEVLALYRQARAAQRASRTIKAWGDLQLPDAMNELHTRSGSPSLRWITEHLPDLPRTTVHRLLADPLSSPSRALEVAELLAEQLPSHERDWAESMVLGPLRSAPEARSAAGADISGLTRVPPQDVPAEQSLLGAMLLSRDAIVEVSKILDAGDFYRPAHELIYRRCVAMHTAGKDVDPFTLAADVSPEELDRMGGERYLHTLVQTVSSVELADWYAQLVRDKAVRRRLIEASARVAQMAYADDRSIGEILSAAHELIGSAARQHPMADPTARRQ